MQLVSTALKKYELTAGDFANPASPTMVKVWASLVLNTPKYALNVEISIK